MSGFKKTTPTPVHVATKFSRRELTEFGKKMKSLKCINVWDFCIKMDWVKIRDGREFVQQFYIPNIRDAHEKDRQLLTMMSLDKQAGKEAFESLAI